MIDFRSAVFILEKYYFHQNNTFTKPTKGMASVDIAFKLLTGLRTTMIIMNKIDSVFRTRWP